MSATNLPAFSCRVSLPSGSTCEKRTGFHLRGRDPFGDKRDGFVNEVIDTYFLFTEISEQLRGIVKGSQESAVPDASATGVGLAAVGAGSPQAGNRVEV